MTDPNDLEVGAPAPDFTLPSSAGDPITLSSFQGKKNVVIFFMREFI